MVVNFVALADRTCHAPAVRHHRANLPMTVIEVTETEIFQFNAVFDDRRHSTDWRQMPCV